MIFSQLKKIYNEVSNRKIITNLNLEFVGTSDFSQASPSLLKKDILK